MFTRLSGRAAAAAPSLAPSNTALQNKAASATHPPVPANCVVTGGSGFVGQRLVEMLVERGAKRVVSFDVCGKPPNAWDDARIEYVQGDLRDADAVAAAIAGADCVWHNGAAVGPYHPSQLYEDVNHKGTLHVIAACRKHGVKKIVMSSSPSTRFDGSDVDGLREAEMPSIPQKRYLQEYAESKANGEKALTDANSPPELLTVAIAPHQVYGPRDNLFLPNLLETAGTGQLRVFGNGRNRICFSHVDNYAHGLIIGERALTPGSPALGKFYIVTDGSTHTDPKGFGYFWEELDKAVVGVFGERARLSTKFALPLWLMMSIAMICEAIGWLLGKKLKLNVFAVKMLTMHRWFDITSAEEDLSYKPIIAFDEGWADTIEWFKAKWLPTFDTNASGYAGRIAKQTQAKIDMQEAGVGDKKKD